MIRKNVLNPRQLYFTTLVTALVFLFAMGFLFFQGNRMATIHAPLNDAAMEIKLEATTAHLWFEEIISGDRHESVDSVWSHLSHADWYAQAMLSGGENAEGRFYPLQDPLLRQQIESVRTELQSFREIAELRFRNASNSSPGSLIDQRFDEVFQHLIDEADSVESAIQAQIAADLTKFHLTGGFILLMALGVSLFLSHFLYHREVQKLALLNSLSDSHQEIELKNQELSYRAHFDQLTGLPNRILLSDRLEQTLAESRRNEQAFAVLFIDLDHFKATNDRYGHQSGDLLLQETALRIRSSIRDLDTASRISGDEFVVLLKTFTDSDHATQTAQRISSRLLEEISQPYQINTALSYVSASIGITIYPQDADSAEQLLQYADAAMYHAKREGRNNYQFHNPSLVRQARQRITLEHDLRQAIQQQQFILYFQPQWDLHSDEILALEALVRWQHPDQGLLSPDRFISISENIGLIHQIDFLVLEQVLKQIQLWQTQGMKLQRVAVNISANTFHRDDFLTTVVNLLTEHSIPGEMLELEITESVLVRDSRHTRSVLLNLQKLGIKIAIDDFGTGFSSMSYLRDLRIDTLKIDRSFVAGYQDSKTTATILASIIRLGCDLGLNIVAEGIETREQELHLKQLGCHTGQGFLCSKPLPVDQIPALFSAANNDNVVVLNPPYQHTKD